MGAQTDGLQDLNNCGDVLEGCGGGGTGWDYEVSRRGGEMVRRCSLASELDGWLDGGPGHAGPGLSGSGRLG